MGPAVGCKALRAVAQIVHGGDPVGHEVVHGGGQCSVLFGGSGGGNRPLYEGHGVVLENARGLAPLVADLDVIADCYDPLAPDSERAGLGL